MPRRYILWDHDGVLVDTERWYFVATRDVLEGVGVELSQETYLEYMARGQQCWDLCRDRGMTDEEVSRHRELRNSIYQEHLRTQEIEIDGVADVLSTLSKSFEMAVVTTARRADVELIHESRGLLGFFQFVLTIEDYQRPKPDPEIFLLAAHRLGVAPDECIVVEDSAAGVAAAKSAGMLCVGFKGLPHVQQDLSKSDLVITSFSDWPYK